MNQAYASLPSAMEHLLDEAKKAQGVIATSWTISDLDLRHLKEEFGDDYESCFGGLPYAIAQDDQESIILHTMRAVPVLR